MGAWGPGPLDNDNALDFVASALEPDALAARLTRAAEGDHPDELRAACRIAKVLLDARLLEPHRLRPFLERAVARLDALLVRGSGYIEQWDDALRPAVRSSPRSQRRALRAHLDAAGDADLPTDAASTEPNPFVENVLPVADLERAVAFYRDVLGFQVRQRGAAFAQVAPLARMAVSLRLEHAPGCSGGLPALLLVGPWLEEIAAAVRGVERRPWDRVAP